jgi:hypothetical protein
MRKTLTRRRSTAIVLYNDPRGDRAFGLRLDAEEARRRAAMTLSLCHAVAMAYEEGARLTAERVLQPFLGYGIALSEACDRARPTYTQLRNLLVGEYDADPIVAARVAMQRIARANSWRTRDRWERPLYGERFWL